MGLTVSCRLFWKTRSACLCTSWCSNIFWFSESIGNRCSITSSKLLNVSFLTEYICTLLVTDRRRQLFLVLRTQYYKCGLTSVESKNHAVEEKVSIQSWLFNVNFNLPQINKFFKKDPCVCPWLVTQSWVMPSRCQS